MTQPLEAKKEILGYTLKERIGSGGFGEVWSAIAPGGLMKALKIVYGFHDEKRALAEMKALDRVKQLRHPFLLSLERIEIYEKQLVVVTELADNSLADVFNDFTARGEPGIPRDDLLKYIRCAADALDYLSDEHQLQHLDIKPENLLMVSGHVKVADFGLIKDLQNASQSLMSGMTPAYAAPELFDGRPGTRSDQYSLAIVYQEMLTGVRPFPGNTPAQLAAQHMHGKPNLRPLPKSDQDVIAKALSKDASVRFNSCRDMAEELSNKKRSVKKAVRRTPPTRIVNDTESGTIAFQDVNDARDVTALLSGALPFKAAEVTAIDPPECDVKNARLQPALIIGVGSTGSRIVEKVKKRLFSRHGSLESIPAIRLLCIDSDRQALSKMQTSTAQGSLNSHEIVETCLRKPERYREKSKNHLSWLSRRWIYNVPRSLQTEGLRPLGRLCFADHFDTICEQIQSALKEIATPESLAKSADILDMDPGKLQPRVFIVTSISGGIGSGMALDLAYAVKLLMNECGMPSELVSGILLHSTYQRNREAGLSAANAFAFLTEMRHFVENGFPGDATIGVPEFEDEPPFDFTYFNDLGNDLRLSEFETKLDKIAEYICLSTATKCSEFFDQCRELEKDLEHFSLRTFGLSTCGPDVELTERGVNQIGRGLVRRWIGGVADDNFDANAAVEREFQKVGLTQELVIEKIRNCAHAMIDDRMQSITDAARAVALKPSRERLMNLSAFMDGMFGCQTSQRDGMQVDPEICLELRDLAGNTAVGVGDQLATMLIEMISGNELNLHRCKQMADGCMTEVKELRAQLERTIPQREAMITQAMLAMNEISIDEMNSKSEEMAKFEGCFSAYCENRVQEFVMRHVKVYYQVIANSLEDVQGKVQTMIRQIKFVSEGFEDASDFLDDGLQEGFDMTQLLSDSIEQEMNQHIRQTEIQIYESLIKERGGYVQALSDSSNLKSILTRQIRLAAQNVLADAYKKISLEKVIAENNITPEQVTMWLGERIRDAQPQVDSCGGAARFFIGEPEFSDTTLLTEEMSQKFEVKACTIKGTRGNFVLCFETENVTLANVAFRLLEARPDAIELVKRIHTRSDVQWTTLDDLL